MTFTNRLRGCVVSVAATLGLSAGAASAYPIDCAILLCLSGGWPASAECSAARAEFIRRITPFPIEPPLQIWRCPMGVAFRTEPPKRTLAHVYKAFQSIPSQQDPTIPLPAVGTPLLAHPAVLLKDGGHDQQLSSQGLLQLIRSGNSADIDIGGPEFDFVRSIRVFHVPLAMQAKGDERGCDRTGGAVRLGTYGPQGQYIRTTVTSDALPEAHTGMEGFGQSCPQVFHRSVFVDWRDYEGNYGFEQVNY